MRSLGRSCSFILIICLTWVSWGFAEEIFVYIDPVEPSAILQTRVPMVPEPLLTAKDLPQVSEKHHAVHFRNQRFTHLAKSPDGQWLSFSVAGTDHGWSGILSLENREVRQLALSFEGESTAVYWSSGSRFLAVEEKQGKGVRFIEVFDVLEGKSCQLDGKVARNKFLNLLQPWWSPQGDKIFFKVEYNNVYRKSVGLKSHKVAHRIGEADPSCKNLQLYSVADFMEKFPEAAQEEIISLSPGE